MLKIGILGGSFDPVHVGHLSIAQAAMSSFSLDKVLLVPANRPPHKVGARLAPAEDRLAMLKLAARGLRGLEVSDIELRRGGASYTIDTITELEKIYPAGARFYFIIGADSLRELAGWRAIGELFEKCVFVTVARPDSSFHDLGGLEKKVPAEAIMRLRDNFLKIEPIPVSSTAVRAAARKGEPLAKLVRGPVARYIEKHKLYKD